MSRPNFPIVLGGIHPDQRAWLDQMCTCGHRRSDHHGDFDGPCIQHAASTAKTQVGRRLEGAVCPCNTFELAEVP